MPKVKFSLSFMTSSDPPLHIFVKKSLCGHSISVYVLNMNGTYYYGKRRENMQHAKGKEFSKYYLYMTSKEKRKFITSNNMDKTKDGESFKQGQKVSTA